MRDNDGMALELADPAAGVSDIGVNVGSASESGWDASGVPFLAAAARCAAVVIGEAEAADKAGEAA